MARIRVPAGTIQKLEKVFDDLQTFVSENQRKRMSVIFKESFGFALDVKNGAMQDPDFQISLSVAADSPTAFVVNSGQMITSGNKYVKVDAPFLIQNIPGVAANQFYLVRIRYSEQGTNLQTSMSSFLYDPQDGETTKYTRFQDTFVIDTVLITEALGWRSGIGANNAQNSLAIGIVKSDSSAQVRLMTTQFTFNDPTDGELTSDFTGVLDLREKQRLMIDHDLLNDKQILMKDRDSTASDGGAFKANLDIEGKLVINRDGGGAGIEIKNTSGVSVDAQTSIAVTADSIAAGTNTPISTNQTITLGAPWTSGDIENDMGMSIISLRRTSQDAHEFVPPMGMEARGVWLKLQGSNRGSTVVGNTAADANTLYFKDSSQLVGKDNLGAAVNANMPNIYALNSPAQHKPLINLSNVNHLALNLVRENRGVIVTREGYLMVGGGVRNPGHDSFTLAGFDTGSQGTSSVSNIAKLYTSRGLAFAAHPSVLQANARNTGIYWSVENNASPLNPSGPFTTASITMEKDPNTLDLLNYSAGLKIQLNDALVDQNVADAQTKFELTSAGMLLLGDTSWLEGNSTDSPDKLHWGYTKNTKLYVHGNAKFTNSKICVTDSNPLERNITEISSTGESSIEPTFKVEGLTSLTGDLHVSGNTKLVGNLDLPTSLTVTGMTTQFFNLDNEFRSANAFQLRGRVSNEGQPSIMALTHALNLQTDAGSIALYRNTGSATDNDTSTFHYFNMSPSGIQFGVAEQSESASIDLVNDGRTNFLHRDSRVKLGNSDDYSTNWLNITSKAPGIFLRSAKTAVHRPNQNLQSPSENATDWFIGSKGGSTSHSVLHVGTPDLEVTGRVKGLHLNAEGFVGIGNDFQDTELKDLSNFEVRPSSVFLDKVAISGDTTFTSKVLVKKDSSDVVNPSAGFNEDGSLHVGTEIINNPSNSKPMISSKGSIHVFNTNTDVNTRPSFTLADSPTDDRIRLMLDSTNKFKIMQGAKTLLSTNANDDGDIVFNNIECIGISGNYVKATQGQSDFGSVQATSLLVGGSTTLSSALFNGIATFQTPIRCSGITSSELRLGVPSSGDYSKGLKVLTEGVTPTKPANIRVADVNPVMGGSANYPFSSVSIHKNWSKVQGTGVLVNGRYQFAVNNSLTPIDATSEELKGKYFQLQTSSGISTYLIDAWDNLLKRMTLVIPGAAYAGTNLGAASTEYDGSAAAGPNYGKVCDAGNKVRVSAVPCDSQGNLVDIPGFEQIVDQSNEVALGLNLDQHYIIRLASLTDTSESEFSVMNSGTYDPDNLVGSGQSIVEYGYPFHNTLPYLVDDGAITVNSSPFGFSILIDGWGTGADPSQTADDWEVAYSTGSVNFENKGNILGNNTIFFTTENRYQEVNVINQATYNVAVRPRQNGQVVGNVKTAVVTAGGGGAPADYVGYFFGEINVLFHQGTIANANTKTIGGKDNGFVTWSGVAMSKTPFTDTANECVLEANEIAAVGGGKGSKIEIVNSAGSVSYGQSTITNHSKLTGGGTMSLTAVVDSFDSGYDTNGNKFVIGNSKDGRKIGQFSVSTDIVIKLAVIDIEWATGLNSGNPGVIRVYQQGQESQAGTMNVGITTGGLSQVMEVEILGSQGPRTIIIDAFDPDTGSPNNTCSIKGTIELYGQAAVPDILNQPQSEL